MRWAGQGRELWRARVDLFAADGGDRRVLACAKSLQGLLIAGDDPQHPECSVDQGLGVEGQPVIGMLFWVRADDVGSAATTAVDVARRAGADHGVGPNLYDVTIIPRDAVVSRNDPSYPAMPD